MKTLMINASMNVELSTGHFSVFVIGLILVPDGTRAADLVPAEASFLRDCRIHFYVTLQKAEEGNMAFFHDTINRKWERASTARGVKMSVEFATEVRTFP